MLVLWCKHSDHITHLEAEIQWLRDRCDHERMRAELAIDTLLALKVGAPPVRPPEPERRETPQDAAERLMQDSEFAGVGNVQ